MAAYIDPAHSHVSRGTDDYQRMAYGGCVAISEPAFWAGFDRGFCPKQRFLSDILQNQGPLVRQDKSGCSRELKGLCLEVARSSSSRSWLPGTISRGWSAVSGCRIVIHCNQGGVCVCARDESLLPEGCVSVRAMNRFYQRGVCLCARRIASNPYVHTT